MGNDAFAEGDINPHSEGTLADNQFKLGTTTARYSQVHGVLGAFGAAHVPSQSVDVYGNIHFGGVGTTGAEVFGSSSLCSAGIQVGVASSRLGNFNWNSRYKTLSAVAGNYAVASGPGAQIQFNASTRFMYFETAQSQNADGTAFTFTDHVTINGQSNFIGIGHANPSQTLDVLGSFYQHANGGGFLVRLSNSSTAAGVGHRLIGIGAVAGSVTFDVGQNAIGNNAGYEISYQNAATVCFYIMPTSSVQIGIGHFSPSQTLDVAGNVVCTKTFVSAQPRLEFRRVASLALSTSALVAWDTNTANVGFGTINMPTSSCVIPTAGVWAINVNLRVNSATAIEQINAILQSVDGLSQTNLTAMESSAWSIASASFNFSWIGSIQSGRVISVAMSTTAGLRSIAAREANGSDCQFIIYKLP